MHRRLDHLLIVSLLVVVLPHFGFAEVVVAMPLEGHYRPGRFMPARLTVSGESAVSLRATGAVTTTLEGARDGQTVVPWLAVAGSIRGAQWIAADGTEHLIHLDLHPLDEQETLVGIAGGDAQIVKELFPEKRIIAVPLDGSELLQPAQAWESLDAAILSAAAEARLSDEQIQTLISAGTILVVRSSPRPDTRWPWRQSGDNWILRHELSGPTPAADPAVFTPTYSWDGGWPVSFRREVIAAAGIFCILAVGLSLWRSRFVMLAILLLCSATAGLFAWRYSRQSPELVMRAGVAVRDRSTIQYDLWSWRSTVRETDISCPAAGPIHPIFAAAEQLDQTRIRLVCQGDGQPLRFEFHLRPNESLAFLSRLVRPDTQLGALQPVSPQWKAFVEDLYLRPGDKIAGQIQVQDPQDNQSVATTVIDRE